MTTQYSKATIVTGAIAAALAIIAVLWQLAPLASHGIAHVWDSSQNIGWGWGLVASIIMVIFTFLCFAFAADESDELALLVAIGAVLITIMCVCWTFGAYDRQHPPFNTKLLEKVAHDNGGYILWRSEDDDHYASFHSVNAFGRHQHISVPLSNMRSAAMERYMGRYYDKDEIADIRKGKKVCTHIGDGKFCATQHKHGKYYDGSFKVES